MIPDPRQQPYTLPKPDNGVSRRRAFFFVIALAILLTSIPIVFMVLRGWLAPETPNEDSTIVVDMEEPAPEEAEYGYAAPAAAAGVNAGNAADGNAAAPELAASGTPGESAPGAPAGPAADIASGQTTAGAGATPPPPAPPIAPAVLESELVKNTVKDNAPKATAEQKSMPPTAKTTASKSAVKREFKPLSKDELAKLKAANAASQSTPQQRSSYNKKLYSFVRSNWSAPAVSAVGGRKLRAVIEVEVAADGTVAAARLKTPSYVRAMDDSVNSLIGTLKRRKAPAPGFATGKITIELKN